MEKRKRLIDIIVQDDEHCSMGCPLFYDEDQAATSNPYCGYKETHLQKDKDGFLRTDDCLIEE